MLAFSIGVRAGRGRVGVPGRRTRRVLEDQPRLPPVSRDPETWPDVVAVVPARNEAEMLPVTLPALLGQEYPGELTVIVVDDHSSTAPPRSPRSSRRAGR